MKLLNTDTNSISHQSETNITDISNWEYSEFAGNINFTIDSETNMIVFDSSNIESATIEIVSNSKTSTFYFQNKIALENIREIELDKIYTSGTITIIPTLFAGETSTKIRTIFGGVSQDIGLTDNNTDLILDQKLDKRDFTMSGHQVKILKKKREVQAKIIVDTKLIETIIYKLQEDKNRYWLIGGNKKYMNIFGKSANVNFKARNTTLNTLKFTIFETYLV